MAAMPGHIQLLKKEKHSLSLFTVGGNEMKQIRSKASKFIFEQFKRTSTIEKEESFDESTVDCSKITDGDVYYSGF